MIQTMDVALCQSSTRFPSPLRAPGLRSLKSPKEWWSTARVCEGEVEKDGGWVKMVAKVELSNPRLLGCVYRRGINRIGRESRY
jgi:hypothetical protein